MAVKAEKRCTWKVRHGLELLAALPAETTADRTDAESAAAARSWIADLCARWSNGSTRSPSKAQSGSRRKAARRG